MTVAVTIVGALAEAAAWIAVVVRKANLWVVMAPVLLAMGIAALATGEPSLAGRTSAGLAAIVGAASGAVLYLATRAFVWVVRGWRAFVAQSARLYLRRGSLSVPVTLVLAGVLAVGEEVFWRGLVAPRLTRAIDDRTLGAAAAYGAFVLANVPSANLAILASALVGGAVWSGLAWWTGGALASALSHVLWTSLMITFPVVPAADPEVVGR